jgi:glycosidase
MSGPASITEIDLAPLPGKTYWNVDREWREEFIYFLLVDRFHDNHARMPARTPERSASHATPDQLSKFCGGTLQGVRQHLDYIRGLGCTALWLSPILENNDAPDPNSSCYHGYSIQNYLDIDPRFGTKQDLIDLVDAAHERGMRVFLDAVLNHSGDNWSYPNDNPYYYYQDWQFPFGDWHRPDRPLPVELRNPNAYHRRGQIRNWDTYPEYQRGDLFALKDYANDEDPDGLAVQNALIQSYCYWMREADIDGFRLDAVKHIGTLAIARFCSTVREYAYRLGKRDLFLFGELIAGDDAIDRYTGPSTPTQIDSQTVYYGLTSALDFPLYWTLPGVIKGTRAPGDLIGRYSSLKVHAIHRGELGQYLVTFLDNHDQVGQDYKRRFATDAPDAQVIAGIGYLLCAMGTACIYSGTEQGFAGQGPGDQFIREPMFDLADPGVNYLNPDCRIYQEIAKIAQVNKEVAALRFGRMYFREISGNGRDFGLPQEQPCTLAFARLLAEQEVLIAYNTSTTDRRADCVIVDNVLHHAGDTMHFLYGNEGAVTIQPHPDPGNTALLVQLELEPMQFVILL